MPSSLGSRGSGGGGSGGSGREKLVTISHERSYGKASDDEDFVDF